MMNEKINKKEVNKMELELSKTIVFTILLGFMPLMALAMAFIVFFNLNRLDTRTALDCTFYGLLLISPALIIVLSLIK